MRRRRYIVNGQHVLAYTTQGAADLVGAPTSAVSLAPRRRDPAAHAPPRWEVNRAELKRYCDAIGLQGIPVIRRTANLVNDGRCAISSNGFYAHRYNITVNKGLTAARAAKTLRHELQHALQAERFYPNFSAWMDYWRSNSKLPYAERPMEIEARAAEGNLPSIRLTRPIRSGKIQKSTKLKEAK